MNFNKLFSLGIGFSCGLSITASSLAAPGDLSKKPLFIATGVQPNILLLVDDSGSMDWEVLLTNDAQAAHSSPPNSGSLQFPPTNNTEKREMCAAYNTMAYDPAKRYTPWIGVDSLGNTYTDLTLTTARDNPYNPSSIRDISTNDYFYYVWNDDGDGVYESGECPTSNGSRVFANSLTSAEQTNYANWYSYYRKREYVVKRALSQIIKGSKERMGIASLHDNNTIGTPIQDVDDITPISGSPAQVAATARKNALAQNLFRVNSSGGTPLRQTLEEAGKYFEVGQSTNLFSTAANSPILPSGSGGQCQQNFSVLLSDGFWNGSDPSVGNTDTDGSGSYDGGSYADTYSDTLADVAMHYYERDLAPLIADNVPAFQAAFDTNPAQHMVTYTVAFGIDGTLTTSPTDPSQAFTWPQPVADSSTSIDDMRHAAWNGRGLFLSAENPSALVDSLSQAIDSIAERQGTAASVSFNTTSISTNTKLFQARFDTDGWHGSLQAFTYSPVTGVGAIQWDAATILSQRDLVTTPRQIITSSGINASTRGIPFRFPADYNNPAAASELSSAQISDLMVNAPNALGTAVAAEIVENQAYGADIVDYLRGDATHEVALPGVSWQFRSRTRLLSDGITTRHNRLGDIVHSSPQFVGKPDVNYPNLIEGVGNEYSTFIAAQASRLPMVYVGANDGMLHGFNANTGQEMFAYVPFAMFSNQNKAGLHYLAEQTYEHIPYVDESPFSTDVFVGGQWRTYLVGGYRAGGKGIYVLDVTNPSLLTEGNANNVVKLEFDHADLGYTFSRPLIGKLNGGPSGQKKWAAIFGNGYNNTGDGRAKLFIVYLDGSGYVMLDTEQGSIVNGDCADPGSDCNGLSSPTILDNTGDAIIDRVYAGDLHGNMWAFDLSDVNPSNWGVAYDNGGLPPVPKPLFQACTSTTIPCPVASRQPITVRPAVGVHPDRLSGVTAPNIMVYFGTGQYVADGDDSTTAQQTMYGIWDAGASNSDLRRANLQGQTITASAGTVDSKSVTLRDLSNNPVNYTTGTASSELGWYIDLPVTKERVVVNPLVLGKLILFTTIIPNTSLCELGGDGFLMVADRLTGGVPPFKVFDTNNDGTIDSTSSYSLGSLGVGLVNLGGNRAVVTTSAGDIVDPEISADFERKSKRTSWTPAR